MKRIFVLLIASAMVFGLSAQANATLFLRGTDTLGNRLIYDTDLNITWYDYTKYDSTNLVNNSWDNQMAWAAALTVDFGGTTYTDWRLPSTVDGPNVFGTDGTTTAGYNITSSEMGHLYYTELGNAAGVLLSNTGDFQILSNTGDFQNLQPGLYWSGTEYSANAGYAWIFFFDDGSQIVNGKGGGGYALAVRPGDVAAVPEPSTMLLVGSGLVGLAAFRKRMRRHG